MMWRRLKRMVSILKSCQQRRNFILGIESSCDDTGAAILSEKGEILGECVANQTSSRFGGVIPSLAMGLHAENIVKVVTKTLEMATGQMHSNLDDIGKTVKYLAVTNRPGLKGSLIVGTNFAKYLSKKYNIPIIPVHHLEAHALTPRMIEKIEFPFVVLLISGGNCLLALAEDVDKFKLLGKSRDCSPGEVLDKVARLLKVHSIRPDLKDSSGGKSVEVLASEEGNPLAYEMPHPLRHERSCEFSFSGFKSTARRIIENNEKTLKLEPDKILPNANDICASVQYGMARHICQRLQRGMIYCENEDLLPENDDNFKRKLVLSGGVAANQMMRSSLKKITDHFEMELVAPPIKYCTDNGVMIAWNGLEKLRGLNDPTKFVAQPEHVFSIEAFPKAQFGQDISDQVISAHIKCKWIDPL